MKNKKRNVTRIINARQVSLEGNQMYLSTICFDADCGYIYGGSSLVEIKSNGPKFWSAADCGFLFPMNYFIGEPQVSWQAKVTQREKRRRYASSYKAKMDIKERKDEGFFVYLPEECGGEELFQKAVENKEKIREWINRWYAYEAEDYRALYRIGESTYKRAMELGKALDSLHNELIEAGVTKSDGTIINPQYMFVIPERKVKQACYNRSKPNSHYLGGRLKTVKALDIYWITPNVCLADNEEDFFEMMKECYGITEIYE